TPPPTGAARKTLGLRIDLNRASARDLQILPGIGPGLARRIVAFRREHGPFASPEELLHVKGIGKKRLLRLQPLITAVPLPHSPGRKVPHLRNRDIVTPLSERKNQNSM
ncbi:MAG: helix-hairpin-helix domain-containing protein, partial [Deltaproteobacteria bacterium]